MEQEADEKVRRCTFQRRGEPCEPGAVTCRWLVSALPCFGARFKKQKQNPREPSSKFLSDVVDTDPNTSILTPLNCKSYVLLHHQTLFSHAQGRTKVSSAKHMSHQVVTRGQSPWEEARVHLSVPNLSPCLHTFLHSSADTESYLGCAEKTHSLEKIPCT